MESNTNIVFVLSNQDDYSTHKLLDCLMYKKINYILLNEITQLKFIQAKIKNNDVDYTIEVDGEQLSISSIKSFFYRRHYFKLDSYKSFDIQLELKARKFQTYKNKEIESLEVLFIKLLTEKGNYIGDYFNSNLNKNYQLYNALKVGLNVPDSCVTINIDDAHKTLNKPIITKSIQHQLGFVDKDKFYGLYTSKINNEDKLVNFFPTQFQTMIEKLYELRIFYLKGSLFSMAIFSQNDTQAKVDFRHYNNKNPNRFIPYKLPKTIETKIKKLMKLLNLTTGSIDMILTKRKNMFIWK